MYKIPFFLFLTCNLCLSAFAQNRIAKDFRQVYLWDVTLSMKGFNNHPDIYDKVVDAIVKDIKTISNERTEIVVIPFQDSPYCEIWQEKATEQGKENLIRKIKSYDNKQVTKTCISAPLKYAIEHIFSTDRIDVMKLMTDGDDNVNKSELKKILNNWCAFSQKKDVYGYYILLTDAAKKDQELMFQLEAICNFEVIDLENQIDKLGQIVQLNAPFSESGIVINVRDEYNKPLKLHFASYGNTIPQGYRLHFTTNENPYITINEESEVEEDGTFTIHPQFKQSLNQLREQMPEYVNGLQLDFEPCNKEEATYSLTRLLDHSAPLKLYNKPEKAVRISIK